jgi:3-oxoacyl-[acyl-carrier protein] reductase
MDLGLTGRVAIVAAASKGLGRAVAEELAREGAQLAICARTPGTLAETAAEIRKSTGREVFHQPLDVTDSTAIASFVPRWKPALAGLTFVSPIPAVLRPTLLRAPSRKSGAPPWTNC